jgi:hypothetical protein
MGAADCVIINKKLIIVMLSKAKHLAFSRCRKTRFFGWASE